ncbi:MAG: ATP-binding cassette domain-containing protein [Candidatus Omnitrophota bacterium]|nr:ATP-binding cassette domain-containing protein [Candidatus Omnitrophota bacterium]
MMVIEIRNLTKKFVIDISPLTAFNLAKRIIKPQQHHLEIIALNNINVEIYKGDRIGLIGDNGSGKTTLLRIISGLYKKTSGIVNIKGKIAAFLQLDIGMERDLTAHENIYLFSAIMGIERAEVTRNLNDIAQFSGIENLLRCPLRDLSSGQIQRIAFSISRYVKSDILLLDEMLAYGDMEFREKYYSIIKESEYAGKTIIAISHEMDLIKKFCNRCLLLNKGDQVAFGPTEEILQLYAQK